MNYLDSVNIFKIFSVLTWSQPSTHPHTHQTIHPPMGGEFFTDFKSSNGIEISWLVQVLSNFYWFLGSPLEEWWMGGWCWGWVWVCGGVPCMHVKHDKHSKHGCLHISGLLQFLYMYTCACVCMHVCTCMWGHSHVNRCPQTPPTTCLLPRATGSPKQRNSISPELIKIIWFCLKILYLWPFLKSYRL